MATSPGQDQRDRDAATADGPEAFRQGHYVLGICGLALLRSAATRRFERVGALATTMREVAGALEQPPYDGPHALLRSSVSAGYAAWAETYDDVANAAIALEEPIIRRLLDDLPPGPVLDAACGTGRHAAYLHAAGRAVVGVDASDDMLTRARAKLPPVPFHRGTLDRLPLRTASQAAAVCSLALCHVPDVEPCVADLARVLKPGGRLIVSDPHPIPTAILGWTANFADASGSAWMIPEYPHFHSEYISAFATSGLTVRSCLEPRFTPERARARAKPGHAGSAHPEAFVDALAGLPALTVWEAEKI